MILVIVFTKFFKNIQQLYFSFNSRAASAHNIHDFSTLSRQKIVIFLIPQRNLKDFNKKFVKFNEKKSIGGAKKV